VLPDYPHSPSWLAPIRESALSRFNKIGFPTIREEEWRFTNVAPFLKDPLHFALEPTRDGVTPEKLSQFFLGPETKGELLVFVNGFFSKELSPLTLSPGGGEGRARGIGSLAEALEKSPETAKRYLSKIAPYEKNGFTALNTAFFQDGAFVHIPEGETLTQPICFLFITSPAEERLVTQPRNLIVLEKGARAALVESYVSLSPCSYFTNAVTEIVLGEKAQLDHYKIQKEAQPGGRHIATTQVHLERGSRFSSTAVSLGAKLERENLNVLLDAEETECVLNGLYLVSEGQHIDHHTRIDHLKPRATSRQMYKGILYGSSSAVFNGKIYVHKDAQKSDAAQVNKNLLLSEKAEIHTKPQLEILNDDVKCTHGAAVGQLDEDQLFYLESRGIAKREARSLLTYGFASEVAETVKLESLREGLARLLRQWFEEEKS